MTENLRVSNSSFKTLQRCEQRYVYKYVENLAERMTAKPLKLGTWLHLLLEAKYLSALGIVRLQHGWKTLHQQLAKDFNRLMPEEKEYYGDIPTQAATIMLGYDYHWRDDDEEWSITDCEQKIEMPLNANWTYVGKIDVVAENEEGLWLWDHKSFGNKMPSDDYRIVDPQSALYDWIWERLTGDKPVGFMFNYLRTKVPAIPKQLKRGGISRARNIDTNWITLATTIKHYGLDASDYRAELAAARARDSHFYNRIYIPKPVEVIKNLLKDIQEKLPRIRALHDGARPTRTLTQDCARFCPYHLLCLTELTGGDGEFIRKHDFIVQEWSEYDDDAGTSLSETA